MNREQADKGRSLLAEIEELERLQHGIRKNMMAAKDGDVKAIEDLAADASLLATKLRDAKLRELGEI